MEPKWLIKQKERDGVITAIAEDMEQIDHPSEPTPPEQLYTVVQGDNIWSIAARLGFSATELLEHNGIEDYQAINPGDILHLPRPITASPNRTVDYELLPSVRAMHIAKPGGAKKWSFANVRKWEDIYESSNRWLQYANVDIVAIAHVPVGEETAAYYMDKLSLGDYANTGRVRYTNGFAWSDLQDGHILGPKPEPVPDDQVEIYVQDGWDITRVIQTAGYPPELWDDSDTIQSVYALNGGEDFKLEKGTRVRVPKYVFVPATEPIIEEPEPEELAVVAPNHYKTTFQPFEIPMIVLPRTTDNNGLVVVAHEFDGRADDHVLPADKTQKIDGLFEHEGVTYARFFRPHQLNNFWYGAPYELLMTEEELYDTELSLTEKQQLGQRLSPIERVGAAWLWVFSRSVKLKATLAKWQEKK